MVVAKSLLRLSGQEKTGGEGLRRGNCALI